MGGDTRSPTGGASRSSPHKYNHSLPHTLHTRWGGASRTVQLVLRPSGGATRTCLPTAVTDSNHYAVDHAAFLAKSMASLLFPSRCSKPISVKCFIIVL